MIGTNHKSNNKKIGGRFEKFYLFKVGKIIHQKVGKIIRKSTVENL